MLQRDKFLSLSGAMHSSQLEDMFAIQLSFNPASSSLCSKSPDHAEMCRYVWPNGRCNFILRKIWCQLPIGYVASEAPKASQGDYVPNCTHHLHTQTGEHTWSLFIHLKSLPWVTPRLIWASGPETCKLLRSFLFFTRHTVTAFFSVFLLLNSFLDSM